MSNIVVAGGHGQIAMALHPLLAERGDSVSALIRNPNQSQVVRSAGAMPVVLDLETCSQDEADAAVHEASADAVVFAAGAGPGSGAERKWSMDRDGAIKLLRAAEAVGARYVMVSAMGAANPPEPDDDDVFNVYLRAKAAADEAVMASSVGWTVVRPGRLTDIGASGRVTVGAALDRGEISRANVAAVLAAVLASDGVNGKAFDLLAGETPIDEALAGL